MRVLFCLVDRANFGRLLPVMRAVRDTSGLTLQVICGGGAVLREDRPCIDEIRKEFPVHAEVHHEVRGDTHYTMALSSAIGEGMYATELNRLKPDVVVLIGDRFEALGAAKAASLMNIPLCHFQGGEVSECVDHRTRNAITQLATWHVPATHEAARRVAEMTVKPESILCVGCPSGDLAVSVENEDDENDRPTGMILAVFHPNTTDPSDQRLQMREFLAALASVPHAVDMLWPNIDAGSHAMHMEIRNFLKKERSWLSVHKTFPPEVYLHKLANTRCAVGNSSSFCRDALWFGTPVVLVGNRQRGRETGENVIQVPCEAAAIKDAVKIQLEHGRYPQSDLYGTGDVSTKFVDALLHISGKAVAA